MASDVPLRSASLPSVERVTELLGAEFARAGFDVEDVRIDSSAQPPRIVVVADGDRSPDLDTLAELSRVAAQRLDALDDSDAPSPYVLEVTSPGVDRPLTTPRHFTRARGRKVEVTLADGERLLARLGPLHGDAVTLVVAAGRRGEYSVRTVDRRDIAEAVVQVEFSAPNRRELELAGGAPVGPGGDAQGSDAGGGDERGSEAEVTEEAES